MRVVLNARLCESNAICASIAPEVFELGDDDLLRVLLEQPEPELESRVEEAARRCPKQALSVRAD